MPQEILHITKICSRNKGKNVCPVGVWHVNALTFLANCSIQGWDASTHPRHLCFPSETTGCWTVWKISTRVWNWAKDLLIGGRVHCPLHHCNTWGSFSVSLEIFIISSALNELRFTVQRSPSAITKSTWPKALSLNLVVTDDAYNVRTQKWKNYLKLEVLTLTARNIKECVS